MDVSLLVLVPASAAIVYTLLLAVIRRRASMSAGLLQFQFLLALLVVSCISSVIWHSTNNDPTWSDALLRVLTWSDLSVAPALLAFVAARYHGKWAILARTAAATIAAGFVGVAISGSMVRAILEPVEQPALVDVVVAYTAVLTSLTAYITAAIYLVYSYRHQRDPFERNRLKFVGVATALIISGLLTNLAPALQQYPVDRSLSLVAAGLIFFSLVRYRLFDIDLAVTQAVVNLGAVALVTPLYLVALVRLGGIEEAQDNAAMYVWGMLLVIPAALVAQILRGRLRPVVTRVMLGADADPGLVASDFVTRAQSVRGVSQLAELIGAVCQSRFEARYTAVLLRQDSLNMLKTVNVQGPFAKTYEGAAIDLDNRLLRRVVDTGDPVTALRLQSLATSLPPSEVKPFGPIADCLLQPIMAHGQLLGLIAIAEHVYDDAYSLSDLRLLTTVAAQAGLAIEGAQLFEQVQTHADTDFLTGLPNHRRLKDVLSELLRETAERSEPFAVAMIDVDNFKLLNDTHGHVAGDDALKKIATYLRKSLRENDIVGRYGGDEFMVLFPGIAEGDAKQILGRIERDARKISLSTEGSERSAAPAIPMRLSWGVASYPTDASTERTLVAAADSDMLKRRYMRRRSGAVHTSRPSLRGLEERDPRRVRIASGLIELLDAKDNYTTEHSQQVASLGLLLAEELRLSEREREDLWLGGLLHDIGKLNVPDEVVHKPGTLSGEEWTLIHEHPVSGAQLVNGLFGDHTLTQIVGCHHERFDGAGYPRGLAGEEIPRLARAVSVCDAYSAMVHDRPYRKGLTSDEALAELRRGAGRQWDPEMVEAFARAITGQSAAA